jgi:two-component system, OmpR family, sensor histidine kinase VicK
MESPSVSKEQQKQVELKADAHEVTNDQSDSFTRIISNPEEIISIINSVSKRANTDPVSSFYFGTMDCHGPEIAVQPQFYSVLQSNKKENPKEKICFIIDIQRENLDDVKILSDSGYEIGHIEGLKGNLGFTRTDYLFFVGDKNGVFPKQMVWSVNADLLKQMKNVFANLWESAIPFKTRVSEIENASGLYETKIVRGREEVISFLGSFLKNIASDPPASLLSVGDRRSSSAAVQLFYSNVHDLARKKTKFQNRYLTEIDAGNVQDVKKILDFGGVQVRHTPNLKVNFVVTNKECVTISRTIDPTVIFPLSRDNAPLELIWSNNPDLVRQMGDILDTLWNASSNAKDRIKELEDGVTPPRIDISTNPVDIKEKFLQLVNSASKEIQIVFPTQGAFLREELIGSNEALDRAAKERKVKVMMLTPLDNEVKSIISSHGWRLSSELGTYKDGDPTGLITIREIDVISSETKITFAIFDKAKSFIIELKDNSKLEFEKAIGLATYSNSKPTVSSYISFFEKLWHESELRESEMLARKELVQSLAREEKVTRQAKLLQDILAHDIVNFNQIIRLQAELLEEIPSKEDVEFSFALKTIISAIDNSTMLLDRARKLGKVMSDQGVKLFSKNLLGSINNSFLLVTKANPTKKITNRLTGTIDENFVLADDLLDDVFLNLYSNAVKFTNSDDVDVETAIEDANDFWKVKIIDLGVGIPDETKNHIFNRYTGSTKGSGLGMSIVRALVVDRYSGKIGVKNTIDSDYSAGTSIEVWLRKS